MTPPDGNALAEPSRVVCRRGWRGERASPGDRRDGHALEFIAPTSPIFSARSSAVVGHCVIFDGDDGSHSRDRDKSDTPKRR